MRRVQTVPDAMTKSEPDKDTNPSRMEMTMNAKTLLFVVAIAASANVFAQSNGRDSVYVPAMGKHVPAKAATVTGRSSVYAGDLPAPVRASEQAAVSVERFGRG